MHNQTKLISSYARRTRFGAPSPQPHGMEEHLEVCTRVSETTALTCGSDGAAAYR